MDEAVISQVKEIEKDILKKLLEVCEENHLRVFVDGGTLLGAVREKHFISYDDDIDVAMLREDYEKLMDIGPRCFSHPYFFQSAYTDKDYYRPHIQIRRSDTCGALDFELSHVGFNQGIFIDVFPYDGVPEDNFKGKIQWFEIKFLKKFMSMLYSPIAPQSFLKRFVKCLLKPLGLIVEREKCYKRFENVCKRYSKSSNTITLLSFNERYRMRLLDRSWYDETVYLPFDEMMVPCPCGYEEVLTSKFGDWKTPREGTQHGNVIFDVNKSYIEKRKEVGFKNV